MNRLTFYGVMALCALYVILTVSETYMYHTWTRSVQEQRDIQNKLTMAEKVHNFLQQLVRRMAIEAQTDPGLADLLHKHTKAGATTPAAHAAPLPPLTTGQPAALTPPPAAAPAKGATP